MSADLTTRIIGYRTWRLLDLDATSSALYWGDTKPGLTLLPQVQPGPAWQTGTNRAVCNVLHLGPRYDGAWSRDHAPAQNCHCGLYAYHEVGSVPLGPIDDLPYVHGAVAAWGRVQVHPRGFRAEFARPIAFAFSARYKLSTLNNARRYAHEHGMKLLPLEELEEFAAGYGQPVPVGMRPDPNDPFGVVFSGGGFISFGAPQRVSVFGAESGEKPTNAVEAPERPKPHPQGGPGENDKPEPPEPVKAARKKHAYKWSGAKLPRFPGKGQQG